MALYTPDHTTVQSEASVTFDGGASSTDAARLLELSGDFDARIYLERSDDEGETWEVISQFDTGSLTPSWHTDAIQVVVAVGTRRIRVDNMSKTEGLVEAIGEEI